MNDELDETYMVLLSLARAIAMAMLLGAILLTLVVLSGIVWWLMLW